MNSNPDTILLLDDDHHFRQVVSNVLTQAGYKMVQAQSAMVATALLAERRPALAIVDYRLPGMNGLEWIEQMRERGVAIPMVIFTGAKLDEASIEHLTGRLNVPTIIHKPVDPPILLEQIKKLLPLDGDLQAASGASAGAVDELTLRELEEELNQARVEYLRDTIEELQAFIGARQVDRLIGAEKELAINLAHKIRGTAGSFGLADVAKSAGAIEDYMSMPASGPVAVDNGTVRRLFADLMTVATREFSTRTAPTNVAK